MQRLRLLKREINIRNSGVSLIEVLLVVVIMAVIMASAYPLGASFLSRNKFEDCVNQLTNSLRVAQLNSVSGKEASNWGVAVYDSKITLFKGTSYSARDSVYDEVFKVSSDIVFDPASFEVAFDRLNGNSSQTITINITAFGEESITVSVNEVGTVDVN